MATLLVITVFLPIVGSLALVLMPRTDGHRVRTIALGVALATLAFSLILLAAFRPQVEGPQFAAVGADGKYGVSWSGNVVSRGSSDRTGSARHSVRSRPRRHQLVAVRPDFAADDHGDLRVVGIDHGARGRALCVPPGTGDRPARAVRQPGRHPVLHLLRVHADPPVLPDRDLGRPATASCLGDVLPLHARRQPADAAGGHRAGRGALSAFGPEGADLLDPRS